VSGDEPGLGRRGPIVRRGTFLYADEALCHLRIVRSDVAFGTGDYEDEPEWRDDREVECYYVEYTGGGTPDLFNNATGPFATIEDAARYVAAWPGVGNTIRWADEMPSISD
jgi:hypothetical protein